MPHRTVRPTPAVDDSLGLRTGRRRFLQFSGLALAAAASGSLLAACGGDDDESPTTTAAGDGGATTAPAATPATTAAGSTETTAAAPGTTTAVRLQLPWILDASVAQLLLADSNGHYEAAGLDVEFIPGGPDIGAIESIVGSGAAEIGIATDIYSVISAIADGSPFVVVGAMFQANLHGFISKPSAPVTTAADLAGKRLGGSQGVQPKYDAIFRLNGMEPDYTFVPSGYGPDLLINGDVDAQSVFITDEVIAYEDATGEAPVLLKWDDLGLPGYTMAIFTTKDYLASNREAVKAFLAATKIGFDENQADPEPGAKLAAEVYGKDAGLTLESEVKKNEKYNLYTESADTAEHGWMWVNPDFVATKVFAGMEAAGLATPPIEDTVDMSVLEELAG